jgi:hypothetical protein
VNFDLVDKHALPISQTFSSCGGEQPGGAGGPLVSEAKFVSLGEHKAVIC